MVGETGFVEDRSAKIFVVKTDSGGRLLWQREFGKSGYNLGNSVAEANDGNYLVAGTLNFDAALIKVDAKAGKTIWSKTWDFGSEDSFEGLTLSNDGGIVLTGYRDGLAEGTFLNWGKGLVLKANEYGQEEWRRDLSGFTSSGYRIQQSGTGFVLCAHPKDEESDNFNLLSLDNNGKVQWAKSYGKFTGALIKTRGVRLFLQGTHEKHL
jgi:hypothetical protein